MMQIKLSVNNKRNPALTVEALAYLHSTGEISNIIYRRRLLTRFHKKGSENHELKNMSERIQ